MYRSTKIFDGFSCCFRQWKANTTHCQYLHGYGVSFKVTFEGNLDHRNWVWDFGGMKRAKTLIDGKQPTVIVAKDDPYINSFNNLHASGVIQLREVEATGAEKFAEFIFKKLNSFVDEETDGRVRVVEVEFMEHGKNTAIYRS